MAGDSSISDGEENEDENSRFQTLATILQLKSEESQSHSSSSYFGNPPPSNGWSMVLIKDSQECSSLIFPPVHHENLQVTSPLFKGLHDDGKPVTPSSSSAFSSEIDDEFDGDSSSTLFSPLDSKQLVGPDSPVITPSRRTRHSVDVAGWLNFGLQVLYSKVRGVLGSFRIPVTAAMVVALLYFRWRSRRVRVAEEGRDRLVGIIREKDERINQLLNQIARMNEVLLGLQGVPASKN